MSGPVGIDKAGTLGPFRSAALPGARLLSRRAVLRQTAPRLPHQPYRWWLVMFTSENPEDRPVILHGCHHASAGKPTPDREGANAPARHADYRVSHLTQRSTRSLLSKSMTAASAASFA